jgi:hypothetical protein
LPKKNDCFSPSDKDIREDVKAQQGHWETHQGTMVMPWSTLGDIGIEVILLAIKVSEDNDNVKKDEGGHKEAQLRMFEKKKTSFFWVVSKACHIFCLLKIC